MIKPKIKGTIQSLKILTPLANQASSSLSVTIFIIVRVHDNNREMGSAYLMMLGKITRNIIKKVRLVLGVEKIKSAHRGSVPITIIELNATVIIKVNDTTSFKISESIFCKTMIMPPYSFRTRSIYTR